jgi:hypothetical protein
MTVNTSDGVQVEGWVAIAAHLSEHLGFYVTPHAAKRWARRPLDPLPVRRWGAGRPRIVADGRALDAWSDRQWSSRP